MTDINYFPQAFLVWQHAYNEGGKSKTLKGSNITSNKKGVVIKKLEGKYAPKAAISKMFGRIHGQSFSKDLLNLENHKISALVPEIRLFRAKDGQFVPFYFPVSADYGLKGGSKLNVGPGGRSFSGGAATIERFTITNTKKEAYSFRVKSITASLSIKIDNISRLFDEPPKGFAPLYELFTFTESTPGKGALLSGVHPRCAVTLGYSVPPGDLFTPQERSTIKKAKIMANLSYQNHDFKIETDGSASITVNYVGFLQEVKDKRTYDALVPSRVKAMEEEAKQERAVEKKKPIGTPTAKKKTPQERLFANSMRVQKEASVIINKLYAAGKIHRIEFNADYHKKKTSTAEAPPPKLKKKPPAIKNIDEFRKGMEGTWIYYFTFGDLIAAWTEKIVDDIDAAISTLKKSKPPKDTTAKKKEKEDLKRGVTILTAGYSTIRNVNKSGSDVSNSGNIADIPVSLDTFYTMMFEHTTKRNKTSMNLAYFLNTFCLELLNKSMDEFTGHGADIIKTITFAMATFAGQQLKGAGNTIKIDSLPAASTNRANTNYYIFHQTTGQEDPAVGNGNHTQDTEEGIYHLHPNKNRGLLKQVNFSMKAPAGFKEWATVRDGHPTAELRMPHSATAVMYANSMFLPGSYIYIDPNTLGFGSPKLLNSAARRLGLGGYYVVGDVTTSYTSTGEMTTTLSLIFDAFPSTSNQPTMPESRRESIKQLRKLREG